MVDKLGDCVAAFETDRHGEAAPERLLEMTWHLVRHFDRSGPHRVTFRALGARIRDGPTVIGCVSMLHYWQRPTQEPGSYKEGALVDGEP